MPPGLPRKAPVILMERFEGLTPERFTKGFLEDDTLYKFYDREVRHWHHPPEMQRSASSAWRRMRPAASTCPRGSEMLRTDRVS